MVFRNPLKQGIFVTTMVLATMLCGLTFLFSLFFESVEIGYTWAAAAPALGISSGGFYFNNNFIVNVQSLIWSWNKEATSPVWNKYVSLPYF
jgi:hypothetical protein